MTDDVTKPRRITIRLTPYQARLLEGLRRHGRAPHEEPRTATDVLVSGLKVLGASAGLEHDPIVVGTPTGEETP